MKVIYEKIYKINGKGLKINLIEIIIKNDFEK
jgi:hypothetical protein